MSSDTSYYRLYPQQQITPKIFFEKTPIRDNGKPGESIDYKPDTVAKIKNESEIHLEDIEAQWKTGIYGRKDRFKSNPFSTMEGVHNYYNEPNLTDELPLFVPSNKIFLNTKGGIHEQWKLYANKTGME